MAERTELLPYDEQRVQRPTLLINLPRATRNIERMHAKAVAADACFRPHFKTHNSHAVGRLFRACGTAHITVSSVEMAEHFASDGWDDITIAFPLNVRALERIREISRRCQLHVLVDSAEAIAALDNSLLEGGIRVWLDVDTGYHRSGIPAAETTRLRALAAAVESSPSLTLAGLLTHAGHTYSATSRDEIEAIWRETLKLLAFSVSELAAVGIDKLKTSVGDTPACSVVSELIGPSEIRPGTFVFYDMQQLRLGACDKNDLAAAIACPVVAVYPHRGEVVVQGGSVHLSRDFVRDPDGEISYGGVLDPSEEWSLLDSATARVSSLSQEHGVVKIGSPLLNSIRVGQLLRIVPAHACLAANALKGHALGIY